jgi:3-oxoacyl-[acyl-carrier-protein] synthase II
MTEPVSVVTGVGLITPLGADPEVVLERVLWGPPAARLITSFDVSGCTSRIGARVEKIPRVCTTGHAPLSRGVALLIEAATRALCDARLESGDPLALSVGGGGGDWMLAGSLDLCANLCLPSSVPHALRILARRVGNGRQLGLYGASASGAQAIAEAKWLLQGREAQAVLVGGYDAMLNPVAFGMLDRLGLLSCRNDDPQAASRPFDADRDGFVLGEGAGALVLESEDHAIRRGARIYGRLVGVGVANGAHHLIDPPADPAGAVSAMRIALADAGLSTQAIDHVLAYGSSSPAYDALETRALKTLFGACAYDLSVSSTKGAFGYLGGAAGVVDFIVSLFALRLQMVPPTLNHSRGDRECDLDYVPRVPRRKRLRTILCNSFGFGGQYVSLIVGEA